MSSSSTSSSGGGASSPSNAPDPGVGGVPPPAPAAGGVSKELQVSFTAATQSAANALVLLPEHTMSEEEKKAEEAAVEAHMVTHGNGYEGLNLHSLAYCPATRRWGGSRWGNPPVVEAGVLGHGQHSKAVPTLSLLQQGAAWSGAFSELLQRAPPGLVGALEAGHTSSAAITSFTLPQEDLDAFLKDVEERQRCTEVALSELWGEASLQRAIIPAPQPRVVERSALVAAVSGTFGVIVEPPEGTVAMGALGACGISWADIAPKPLPQRPAAPKRKPADSTDVVVVAHE
jgi:hypothetical protein